MATDLKAALRRRREKTVVVREIAAADGQPARTLSVRFLRPPESEMGSMMKRLEGDKLVWFATLDHVKKYVTDWDGFTEADLLGATVGPVDIVVPFDVDLWEMVVTDDNAMLAKVIDALIDCVVDYINAKGETAKN